MSDIVRKRRVDSDTANAHLTANMTIVACPSRYTRGLRLEAYRPNISSPYDYMLHGKERRR